MSRDKQFDEHLDLTDTIHMSGYGLLWEDCTDIAHQIQEQGYRKASDVARETVEAIKSEVKKEEQYVNDLFGYGGYVIATTDLEDIIRRYIFDTYEEAELKKKYESEGEG